MSSFMFFANEKRQGLRAEHPELKITDIGKELGKLWKLLTEDEKKKYIDAANQDKARYHTAMSTYVKSPSDTDSDDGQRRRRRKKKKNKDPNKPKRSMSSFMYFANEQRQSVRDKYPDIKITEIGKKLSEMWKVMSQEEKQKYIDQAEKDKNRYTSEMEIYKKKGEVPVPIVHHHVEPPHVPQPSESGEDSESEESDAESSSEGEE